jgi:hypothetical protein
VNVYLWFEPYSINRIRLKEKLGHYEFIMSKVFKYYAVYDHGMLYPVIKCECGNKQVADPRVNT